MFLKLNIIKNAHIINFLKTFSFNPSCKKILDDLDNLNNNNKAFDKDEVHDIIYKVVLYKYDLSCLIQKIKEDKIISENVYKLLVDRLSEDNTICLIMDFSLVVKKQQNEVHVEYVDCILRNKEDKNDIVFLLDTLVYFSDFASFIKTWLNQHDNLHEELYNEMPDFLWFFKVFLTTQHENYFEPNCD